MPRIWVTVTKETKEFLDQEIAKKRFYNYSHAVDFIITRFMESQKTDNCGKMKGNIYCTVNHE